MLKWYYKIWVDAITLEQSKIDRKRNWKLYTIVPISVLQGLNLLTLFYWMRIIFNRHLLLFMPVSIFSAKPLNDFVSVIITFFIPFAILNYLAIFSNDSYKELMQRYNAQNGKLYKRYSLISVGVLIIPLIIKVMFF